MNNSCSNNLPAQSLTQDQIMAEMFDIGRQLCNRDRRAHLNALRQFQNLLRDLAPRRPARGRLTNRPPTA